jgi:plastocyanin
MVGRFSVGLTLVLACLVLAAQAWAATSRSVSLRDNFITVSSATAPHGSVTFSVANNGHEVHTFNIKRVGGKVLFASNRLASGAHISVTRTLTKGNYRLYCTIHAGMTHAFTVS